MDIKENVSASISYLSFTDLYVASSPQQPPFQLEKAAIITDLSSERPQWILSAYGPGRQAPAQLFGGPLREQSFEEMRLLHYIGVASGNPQQAVGRTLSLYGILLILGRYKKLRRLSKPPNSRYKTHCVMWMVRLSLSPSLKTNIQIG